MAELGSFLKRISMVIERYLGHVMLAALIIIALTIYYDYRNLANLVFNTIVIPIAVLGVLIFALGLIHLSKAVYGTAKRPLVIALVTLFTAIGIALGWLVAGLLARLAP